MIVGDQRMFVLTPKDREGVVMGLGWPQLCVLGGASLLSILLLMAGTSLFLAAVLAAIAALVAYGRWRGLRLVEWCPVLWHFLRRVRRGREWVAGTVFDGSAGDLPDCLRGIRIERGLLDGREVGVISDTPTGALSAVLEVEGTDFKLVSDDEQVRLLEGWGRVLSAHAVEGSPVRSVSWTQIATRGSLVDHMNWVRSQYGDGGATEPARSYRRLVEAMSPRTTRHSTYVTVTVGGSTPGDGSVPDVLTDSLRAVWRSLENAELRRWRLLDAGETAALLLACCDPTASGGLASRVGSLAERVGVQHVAGCGPREAWLAWAWFETDRCAHVTFIVEDWPRYPVGADWLSAFLASGRWARRVHVCFEPVSPHMAHKRIERQAFKLDADAAQREDSGRRISAGWRQARHGVDQREEELVSGYAEMSYYGLVTVSAFDGETLDDAVAGILSAARASGVTLRPLVGLQDVGWAASLPVGLVAGSVC